MKSDVPILSFFFSALNMTSSIAARSKIDEEVCADALKFVTLYNDLADIRRNRIGVVYAGDQATFLWNGNLIQGAPAINTFWNSLPETRHEPACLDAHPLEPGSIVIQVMGSASVGGINRAYNQVFVIAKEEGTYKIKSDCYRFME